MRVGRPNNGSHGPISGTTASRTGNKGVYALSGVFTVGAAPGAPDAPSNLRAAPASPTQIDLTWTAPANDNGSAIAGYRIEVSDDAEATWADLEANTGNTETKYSHQGLTLGDTRHYRVSAINGVGTSEPSNVDEVTTTDRDPPKATITYEGRVSGGFEVKVTWNEEVEGFAEIDAGTGKQHDLHAGYTGGPGLFIETVTEETAGLVYTAVVPVARPSGDRRLSVYIVPGAATGVMGGLEKAHSYLHFAVDEHGYPTEIRAPVVQRMQIMSPGGSMAESAFSPRSGDMARSSDIELLWSPGDAVEVRLTFSEPVTVDVSDGTPTLGLVVGGGARSAAYSDGSGTATLTFSYRVTSGDGTVTAVAVTENSLALNGATIRNGEGMDADLRHPGASFGVMAGAEEPALTVADAEAASGTLSFRVALSRAAEAAVTVDYATADGTAVAGTDYEAASGTLTFAPGETVHAVTVTVLADGVAEGDETLTLELSDPAGTMLDDATATGTIADSGEPAPAFEPLTVSFTNAPSEHDGENAFSFEVAFSEDIGISYKTLRDESFTVTGGDVTGARRVDGSKKLWKITVESHSREAVTITLPGSRACGATGAVCTGGDDPRPLSNSPSVEIAGPPAAPLTASFNDMPAEHTGESFTFGLTFSENFGLSYRTLRDEAFTVAGGVVRKVARATQGSRETWLST